MNNKNKKILVFGGSFNPPTLAHMYMADRAAEGIGGADIVFVPTHNNYAKKDLASAKDRVEMLTLAIKEYNFTTDRVYIDNIEVNSYRQLATIETLDYIEKSWNDKYDKHSTNESVCTEVYFFCGADNLEELPYWQGAEHILWHHRVITTERFNFNLNKTISKNKLLKNAYEHNRIIILDNGSDIFSKTSSTKVRKEIGKNKGATDNIFIKENLAYAVAEYIKEKELYK